MGRYEILNPTSKDLVDALIPAISKAFNVPTPTSIIPADILMRPWDVLRRDHMKHLSEKDPRNWGVQFLEDLRSIGRLLKDDENRLERFQRDLRGLVEGHAKRHAWCQRADIAELKKRYLDLRGVAKEEEGDGGEENGFLEEKVERGVRRGRGNQEFYEVGGDDTCKRLKSGWF